jgi:sensor histidine kinase YesM
MVLRLLKLWPVLLLGALLAPPSPRCWAQGPGNPGTAPALVITHRLCQLVPGDALWFFRDPSRRATLPEVLAKSPDEWSAFKGRSASFGYTRDIFWLRLRLRSALVENAESVVVLDTARMERVDWFAFRNGELKEQELNGNQHLKFGPRPRSREPSFRVKLAAGEEVEVLARVETRTSMHLPVLVYGSVEAEANEVAKRDWLALAVAGYFGSMVCLSVVLGFILRSRLLQINAAVSLLLCAYFLLIDGSWARLGLPFAAELAMKPTMILIACMDFLVLLFMREFVPSQLKNRLPSRALSGMLVVVVVEILVILILSYRNEFRVVAFMSVAVMATCTGAAWWLRRAQRGGGTRLLLAAWLTNLFVVVVVILELTGVIPTWLPLALAPVIYGATISGLFLAASTQRAHEFMREQVRASQLEKSLVEARLLALRYQVNPHFLFNALNSAIAMVNHEPTRVTPFLHRLASFLRSAVRAEQNLTVPLVEEIEKLSAYLDVEKVRFEERLEVTLDFPPELGQCQVPELILQPLLENAIRHGMNQSAKVRRIRLGAAREGDRLHLEVANTGQLGMGADPAKHTGGGLNNLRERLKILYQERGNLTLTEADGWVYARLSLPVVERAPAPDTVSAQPPEQSAR